MQRPRVSTNLAISADGKISSVRRIASGWTSRKDHARLLALRENADALLIGRGTLEADRMTLTSPGNPLRCIVSRSGVMDADHPVFKKSGGAIHLLVTGEFTGRKIPGVTVHRNSLTEFLGILARDFHVGHLHCEGGGQLVHALAEMDAIDEFHMTLAGHTLFGGLGAPTATGMPGDFLPKSVEFRVSHFEPMTDEGECFLSYTRRG